jgi:type IV pilus assembly protein PilE
MALPRPIRDLLSRAGTRAAPLRSQRMGQRGRPSVRVGARGFTLIELMTVVVVLAVLAVVAIGAYQKQIRNARKAQVISDLSNLQLKEKSFFALAGRYASTAANEESTYPRLGQIVNPATALPIDWIVTDPEYTATGQTGSLFNGGDALHGFDALRFLPEGNSSYCGYGVISGWGDQVQPPENQAVPPNAGLGGALFPVGAARDRYAGQDWFYAFALCDFDQDGRLWAFTTTNYDSAVNSSPDSTIGSIGAYACCFDNE